MSGGIWGVLVVFPLYFLESMIDEQQPPPITHPEYYYGFARCHAGMADSLLRNRPHPIKYRPIMLIAILEKLSYGLTAPLLFATGRVPGVVLLTIIPELVRAALFAIAYSRRLAIGVEFTVSRHSFTCT